MDLKALLKKNLTDNAGQQKTAEELEQIESEHFQKCMTEQRKSSSALDIIPKFYNRLPKENELIRHKLREVCHSMLLKRKGQSLLDNDELKEVWMISDQNLTNSDEELISFANYQKIVSLVQPKAKLFLTSVVFTKLQQGDPQGRVSIVSVFNYVMRKMWLQQTRIGLSCSGQGFLTEVELENYITELLPTLPQLAGTEKSFHSFYVCTAVRKFVFFLDPLRTGRVRILDILACSFLDDLLELRDEELSKEMQEQNWFSAPSTLKVYGHYLNLDKDRNGMLSKSELAGYGSGSLTQPFLDRVFQTLLTYSGEMDYKTYLDLVLALENRSKPQAIGFLFRILDINSRGYLDAFTLHFFFRGIQEQMRAHGADAVSFEDVKDELFDMVRPKDPERIALSDLIACGQGDTFISILIEFHRFWAFENRDTRQD